MNKVRVIVGALAAASAFSVVSSMAVAQDCLTETPGSLPADSASLLEKALPDNARSAFENYNSPVAASPLVDFKPANNKPWVIGYNNSYSGNAWRASALAALQADVEKYKRLGLVKDLIVTDSNGDITTQIQQMRSLIQRGVDVIISMPGSPTAMNGVIDEAVAAGIPVITFSFPVTTPNAINVDINAFLYGKIEVLGLARLLGGKGTILTVEGIPGTSTNELIKAGGETILKNCPDIKVAGKLVGQWSESVAQTAVLQQLSTNPVKIDGVWQQGSMFMGITKAFQQAGRPSVPVTIGNPNQNSLAYWHDHLADGYKTISSANPPGAGMDLTFRTAMKVMLGQGIKVSNVVAKPPLITADQLNDWWKPEYTEDSTGVADPKLGTWVPDSVLDGYFTNPAALPN